MADWISIVISGIAVGLSGFTYYITKQKFNAEKQKINITLMSGSYQLFDKEYQQETMYYKKIFQNPSIKISTIDLSKMYKITIYASLLIENKSSSNVSILDILGYIYYSDSILKRNNKSFTAIVHPAPIRSTNYNKIIPQTIPPYGSVKLTLELSWEEINFFDLNRFIYAPQDLVQQIQFWEEYPLALRLVIKTTNEYKEMDFPIFKVFDSKNFGILDSAKPDITMSVFDDKHNFKIFDKWIDNFGILGKQKIKKG